jgi:hypothetical protein
MASPKVQAAVRAGLFGVQPVYIITGIKIASGFSTESWSERYRESGAEAKLPVSDQVSVGGELHASKKNILKNSFKGADDIVFAYQLHVIKQKGRKDGAVLNIDNFESKAAFLSDEDLDRSDIDDMAASPVTIDDLPKSSEVTIMETQDGDDKCICVSFSYPS